MILNIVLDTNVLIAAARSSQGASFRVLELALTTQSLRLQISTPLLLEYEAKLLERTSLQGQEIQRVLSALAAISKKHKIYFLFRTFLPDPKDAMVLELAVTSKADYIVTHNIKDFLPAISFGIPAITPKDFLTILNNSAL